MGKDSSDVKDLIGDHDRLSIILGNPPNDTDGVSIS